MGFAFRFRVKGWLLLGLGFRKRNDPKPETLNPKPTFGRMFRLVFLYSRPREDEIPPVALVLRWIPKILHDPKGLGFRVRV